MEMLLDRDTPPDHIVIETSGLALPKPLVKAFTWPEIRARVTVDGVIAVVDAPAVAAGRFAHDPGAVAAQRAADDNLDHHSPLEEVFEDQLLSADMVLLNKADLTDAAGLATARAVVEAELPRQVKIVETRHGQSTSMSCSASRPGPRTTWTPARPITRARTTTITTISTASRYGSKDPPTRTP